MVVARYFFHLKDGADTLIDPEGRELADDQVEAAALGEARAMIAADALSGTINLDQTIEIRNAAGEVIHRRPFEDAVAIRRGARPA